MAAHVTEDALAVDTHFVSPESLREKLDWFNRLRWWAVAGMLLATAVATHLLSYELPTVPLIAVALALALMNLGYVIRNARIRPVDILVEIRLVKVQMVGDLIALTVLLNLSGGIENPLYFLYLIHVIIASLLFKGRDIFRIAWLAILLFTGDALGEHLGILPHTHLITASEVSHELPFMLLILATFWLVLLFCAYIGASIMRHNRAIKNDLVHRQDELIQADRAKMDFFRFITHEVKSPINTAQSAVEVALDLSKGQLPGQAQDMLQRAVGQLRQATAIVMDLADLTRSGMLKAENLRMVDLNQLVREVVEQQAPQAERRFVRIEASLPEDPVVVRTNEAACQKIMTNLVSNAVRYNRENGKVFLRLADDGKETRLDVEDTGIGIAQEDLERIFEEFYRATAAQQISQLGTGLGLPIVKRFVEKLGGTIAVRSTVDRGSTFSITLPRLPA